MTIIEIAQLENGAHRNQSSDEPLPIPEGWAVLPGEVGNPNTLKNFPFGSITVETFEDVPIVTSWTPLTVPETPAGPEPEPSDTPVTWAALAASIREGVNEV